MFQSLLTSSVLCSKRLELFPGRILYILRTIRETSNVATLQRRCLSRSSRPLVPHRATSAIEYGAGKGATPSTRIATSAAPLRNLEDPEVEYLCGLSSRADEMGNQQIREHALRRLQAIVPTLEMSNEIVLAITTFLSACMRHNDEAHMVAIMRVRALLIEAARKQHDYEGAFDIEWELLRLPTKLLSMGTVQSRKLRRLRTVRATLMPWSPSSFNRAALADAERRKDLKEQIVNNRKLAQYILQQVSRMLVHAPQQLDGRKGRDTLSAALIQVSKTEIIKGSSIGSILNDLPAQMTARGLTTDSLEPGYSRALVIHRLSARDVYTVEMAKQDLLHLRERQLELDNPSGSLYAILGFKGGRLQERSSVQRGASNAHERRLAGTLLKWRSVARPIQDILERIIDDGHSHLAARELLEWEKHLPHDTYSMLLTHCTGRLIANGSDMATVLSLLRCRPAAALCFGELVEKEELFDSRQSRGNISQLLDNLKDMVLLAQRDALTLPTQRVQTLSLHFLKEANVPTYSAQERQAFVLSAIKVVEQAIHLRQQIGFPDLPAFHKYNMGAIGVLMGQALLHGCAGEARTLWFTWLQHRLFDDSKAEFDSLANWPYDIAEHIMLALGAHVQSYTPSARVVARFAAAHLWLGSAPALWTQELVRRMLHNGGISSLSFADQAAMQQIATGPSLKMNRLKALELLVPVSSSQDASKVELPVLPWDQAGYENGDIELIAKWTDENPPVPLPSRNRARKKTS